MVLTACCFCMMLPLLQIPSLEAPDPVTPESTSAGVQLIDFAHLCCCRCCRYLAWKHLTLLHLDYMAAWFGLVYLAVLLWRLMHEPTALFYFAVILTKLLPHIPLVLGMRNTFLRCVLDGGCVCLVVCCLVTCTVVLVRLLVVVTGWRLCLVVCLLV